MLAQQEKEFVSRINENLGIAHKISNIYVENTADREDLFQEMMFQLWRGYGSFDGRSKFSTWMYRVCLNTALTFKRKNKNRRTVELTPDHTGTVAPPGSRQGGSNCFFKQSHKYIISP